MSGMFKEISKFEWEILTIDRRCLRLRKTFKQEKEDALLKGREQLLLLRERARTHYCPEIISLQREMKKLEVRLKKINDVPLTIFQEIEELNIELNKSLAHITSTSNRLLRSIKESVECSKIDD